jgi:hypothetical protein
VTRQQLDELDALLQRMLELPVQSLEDRPAAAEPAAPVSLSVLDPEPELTEAAPAVPVLRTDLPAPAAPPAPAVFDEADAEAPLPVWLWPVVWGNQAFDVCVGRLGRPGRWLLRPGGRALLGWTGLLLLGTALALLVYDWVRTRW